MSDHNDSSSEDDEDYVPIEGEGSELESEDEGSLSEGNEDKGIKRKKGKKEILSQRKRKGGIRLDEDGSEEYVASKDEITEEKSSALMVLEELSEELKKKKADELWSSFLKDVSVPSKPKLPLSLTPPCKPCTESSHTSLTVPHTSSEKITVTKIYNFAGEEVKITEELKVDSKETVNKQLDKSKELSSSARLISTPEAIPAKLIASPAPQMQSKGLSSILNKITNKKNNINTLMKSKLDWESFKSSEGIKEELQIHNKGKGGYLEKMAFLERTDLRQFEIEKNLRTITRSKK